MNSNTTRPSVEAVKRVAEALTQRSSLARHVKLRGRKPVAAHHRWPDVRGPDRQRFFAQLRQQLKTLRTSPESKPLGRDLIPSHVRDAIWRHRVQSVNGTAPMDGFSPSNFNRFRLERVIQRLPSGMGARYDGDVADVDAAASTKEPDTPSERNPILARVQEMPFFRNDTFATKLSSSQQTMLIQSMLPKLVPKEFTSIDAGPLSDNQLESLQHVFSTLQWLLRQCQEAERFDLMAQVVDVAESIQSPSALPMLRCVLVDAISLYCRADQLDKAFLGTINCSIFIIIAALETYSNDKAPTSEMVMPIVKHLAENNNVTAIHKILDFALSAPLQQNNKDDSDVKTERLIPSQELLNVALECTLAHQDRNQARKYIGLLQKYHSKLGISTFVILMRNSKSTAELDGIWRLAQELQSRRDIFTQPAAQSALLVAAASLKSVESLPAGSLLDSGILARINLWMRRLRSEGYPITSRVYSDLIENDQIGSALLRFDGLPFLNMLDRVQRSGSAVSSDFYKVALRAVINRRKDDNESNADFNHRQVELLVSTGNDMIYSFGNRLPNDLYHEWITSLVKTGSASALWQHWAAPQTKLYKKPHRSLPVFKPMAYDVLKHQQTFLTAFRQMDSPQLLADFVRTLGHLTDPLPLMASGMIDLLDSVQDGRQLRVDLPTTLSRVSDHLSTLSPSMLHHVLYTTVHLAVNPASSSDMTDDAREAIGLGLAPEFREALETSLLGLVRRIRANQDSDETLVRRVVSVSLKDLDDSIRSIQAGSDISEAILNLDNKLT
jgi:hypothetical protein